MTLNIHKRKFKQSLNETLNISTHLVPTINVFFFFLNII